MNIFDKCKKIFIDFDGVVVDSNKFKEKAIQNSIFALVGKNQNSIDAINYFNINAGISRRKKLSLFFSESEVLEIMKIYASECNKFFKITSPTIGFNTFLEFIRNKNCLIKIYILSGGEKDEIKYFLEKNNLIQFFEAILGSEKSKSKHLEDKQATENDIFIGDSKNDLKASSKSGLKFILFEQYKSLKSFPSQELINNNVYIRTKNFQTLINNFLL